MEGPPPAKRAKTSHHANQLEAVCYCARCDGKYIQNARTIAEHARKYTRRPSPPARPPPDREGLGDVEILLRRRAQTPPEPPRSPSQPPSPFAGGRGDSPRPPIPPADWDQEQEDDDEDDLDMGVHEDGAGNGRNRDEDEELPEWEPNGNQFDHLDRDDEVDLRARIREVDWQGEEMEDGYDEDFGLPNGANDEPPEREIPQFQMPMDELAEPEDDPPDIDIGERCAAFREHELIRNAYVDALVQKILYGATHSALAHQLRSAKRTISAHPDVPLDDLAKMAQTIQTVERRLGVSTDDLIKTYTLCPKCGRCYSPDYIAESNSTECLNDCDGVLYVSRPLASGAIRRASSRTFPFASPITWLQHIFSLPGMSELVQNWREEEDEAEGRSQPISAEDWMDNLNPNKPLGDLSDGWGWRAEEAGLQRVEDPGTGEVRDVSQVDAPLRHSSLPLGISVSLNTNWFQPTKEGNYSVGACYLVLNSLPRHLRFLRENICLAIVMPGPGEPNSYALEQILGPLIDDLLELRQGVRMTIREGDPPIYREQFVHVHLTQHIADLIACIKMGGGAGLRSEHNFCLHCHTRLSSLSVPAGFKREGFEFRDPGEELSNAYFWKSLDNPEDRKVFFDFTGIRFTALHRLPGWYTTTCSPLDAMHILYQGGMNWIVKQILYGPGMFNKCQRGDEDPMERFNACLNDMVIPNNFSRRPPKIGQTNTRVKADQWKLLSRIIFVPLYMAFRRGDNIPNDLVPRGTKSSTAAKHQARRAKLLHRERVKHYNAVGQPNQCPTLEQCFSTRSLVFHYQQVLRFSLATGIIDKRAISSAQIGFATRMLETLSINYVRNNVPVPQNFHYMMHFDEFLLKFGSVYNTHVWGMERANGIITHINHNGRREGMMEGTFMRGWWGYTTLQNLINIYQSIRDPSPADTLVIQDLLKALRGGLEHAQQAGTLMAYLAQCRTAYTRLYGIQEPTQLSNQSTIIKLQEHDAESVFAPKREPYDTTATWSTMVYDMVDFIIQAVLYIEFPERPCLCSICILVRPFQRPLAEPQFPWNRWANHLGVSSWLHDKLGPVTAISVNRLSGVFALFDVPRTDGRYWVTVALDSVLSEEDEEV